MNTICKVNVFIFGFVCLLSSCDFSDSFGDKVKDLITSNEECVDDENRKEYVVNEERLDSISQNLNLLEHRVYYVDCSGSMTSSNYGNNYGKGNTLLKKVKDSLKVSLLNLDIDSVDIDIIPFYGRKWNNGVLQSSTIYKRGEFSLEDRKKIDEIISSITVPENSDSWNTHHSIPINDFLTNRISNKKQYHIMILLTDGVDDYNKGDDKEQSGTDALSKNWIKSCNENNIYGIYDNLPKDTIKGSLPQYFMKHACDKLFWIPGVNFNINIFQLSNTVDEVLLRKDSLIRIPFAGKLPERIELETKGDKYYRYEIACRPNKNEKYLKIKVSAIHNKELPNSWPSTLRFVYDWGKHKTNTYNFPDGEVVSVTIVDEKTPHIKFLVPSQTNDSLPCVSQELGYYKKLFGLFGSEWSDTITIKIPYEKSKDAQYKEEFNKIKLKVSNLPDYVTLLSGNEFCLDKPSDTLSVVLTLNPSSAELCNNLIINGCFEVTGAECLKGIFVNNVPFDNIESSTKIGLFKIETDKRWHPILIFLLCLISLSFLLWLLVMDRIKAFRSKQPRFKFLFFQFSTIPDAAGENLNPNHILIPNDFGFSKEQLNEYIRCVRISVKVRANKPIPKTWNLRNWWNLKLAMRGDVYERSMDENVFASEIEMRPSYNGIEIYVDGIRKCEITQLEERYQIGRRGDVSLYVRAMPNVWQ